jgi:hypothetical protein
MLPSAAKNSSRSSWAQEPRNNLQRSASLRSLSVYLCLIHWSIKSVTSIQSRVALKS